MQRRDFVAAALLGAAGVFTPGPAAAQSLRRANGYIRTNWSRDPFSLGSYSYIARGASRGQVDDLRAPVAGRIFFAGEAVHPDYNSTVHAAHESGLLAAGSLADTNARRIAVIGAGMSGLSAAQALGAAGRAVTVFEARGRIGGRIWTDTRLGLPLDLGASWIHGRRGNPLVALAESGGIDTRATDDSYIIRGAGGRAIRNRDAPDWLDAVEVQTEFGADPEELNTGAYLSDRDYGGADLIFPGGYAQMLRLLDGVEDIRLDTDIRLVSLTESGVMLGGAGGMLWEFDAVIVTVPLGVLKQGRITFDPALPETKLAAIRDLGMGLLDKLYMRYDSVFWDTDVTWIVTPETGLPPGQFNEWLNLYRYTGAPVIMAFNGAGPARDLAGLADAEILSRAEGVLARAYP